MLAPPRETASFSIPLADYALKICPTRAAPMFDGDCGTLSLPGKLPWPVRGNLPQTPGRDLIFGMLEPVSKPLIVGDYFWFI